jgi:lipopolysaccharide transport system permease protein
MSLAALTRVFSAPADLIYRHRVLTWELAKREIRDKYAGQLLGIVWMFGHPIIMIAVYIFIFQFVFKVKVGNATAIPLGYTVYLLAGMLPWLAFQEVLGKGATIMHTNASLVKQVVFPLEVLPLKSVLASLLTQLVGTVCLIGFIILTRKPLPWTYLLLPLLWTIQLLAMAGISLVLAAVGAYVRDLKDIVQVFCTVGLYLMPIAYLPEWVPAMIRPLLYLNPFSYVVWCYQDVCYFGRFEHPWAWLLFLSGAPLLLITGFALFRKLKVCFGSVL